MCPRRKSTLNKAGKKKFRFLRSAYGCFYLSFPKTQRSSGHLSSLSNLIHCLSYGLLELTKKTKSWQIQAWWSKKYPWNMLFKFCLLPIVPLETRARLSYHVASTHLSLCPKAIPVRCKSCLPTERLWFWSTNPPHNISKSSLLQAKSSRLFSESW